MKSYQVAASVLLAFALTGVTPSVKADTLGDIAKAMGADKVKSIEYSGAGNQYALGQPETPTSPWPRFSVPEYKITINYDTGSMIRDKVVANGDLPKRGGGRAPAKGRERQISGLSGKTAWSVRRGSTRPSGSARLKHTLWLSPHGVVKAVQAAKSEAKMRTSGGKDYKTFSFGAKGAFQATAWFGRHNMLRGVDSTIFNAVYGDLPVRTLYSDYKKFDGVPFPTKIKVISAGFPTMDVTIKSVKINAAADIKAPEGLRRSRGQRVTMNKAAEGVWFVAGASHNSVAIEMKDHILLVEAPRGDARVKAVLREVRKTIPGKPISAVLNTHLHFDHSGGLRAAASEGIAIATFRDNVKFLKDAYAGTDKIKPDAYAKSKKQAKFIPLEDKHVFSDGTRSVEMHRLIGNPHNNGLYVIYLPKEKILSVADAYSGRSIRKAPAKRVSNSAENLWQNLVRLKLDIETVLPIHGKKVGFEQLKMTAGQKP